MNPKSLIKFSTLCLCTLLLSGCAKSNLAKIHEYNADVGSARPTRVLLQDFNANAGAVETSSSPFAKLKRLAGSESLDQEKQDLIKEVNTALTSELSEKLSAMGLAVERVSAGRQPQANELLLSGRFLEIEEGNAVRRNLIGLGAGQSTLDCEVHVTTRGSTGIRELLNFNAHADSGNMPGAAVMGPAGAAAGAGKAAVAAVNVAKGAATSYQSSSAHQATQIADKIRTELSSYFAKQGWATPEAK